MDIGITAEDLYQLSEAYHSPKQNIERMLKHAQHCASTYGSWWCSIQEPTQEELDHLKILGFRVFRKKTGYVQLPLYGEPANEVYKYSINWSGVTPVDQSLEEL